MQLYIQNAIIIHKEKTKKKIKDFVSCKIPVFVICGVLRNCIGCYSLHLTFNMDQNLQF